MTGTGLLLLEAFDGCDALIMEQELGEETYLTYIYANDQSLKELFIKSGVNAKAADGRTILDIQNFPSGSFPKICSVLTVQTPKARQAPPSWESEANRSYQKGHYPMTPKTGHAHPAYFLWN